MIIETERLLLRPFRESDTADVRNTRRAGGELLCLHEAELPGGCGGRDEDGSPHYENTMQYAILKKEWRF